jgi:hypothetical protein
MLAHIQEHKIGNVHCKSFGLQIEYTNDALMFAGKWAIVVFSLRLSNSNRFVFVFLTRTNSFFVTPTRSPSSF